MKLVGDIDLELAEHAPESCEMLRVDPLPGEAQNAMGAERPQDAPEVVLADGTGQIDVFDAGAQRAAAGSDLHLPLALVTVLALDCRAFSHHVELAQSETVARKRNIRVLSRRQALSAITSGASLLAIPPIIAAQAPLKVAFVQQRGLLYLPVDLIVSGGILQKEASKLGLGQIEATATALSGPGSVLDAILSGAADYGTVALPSLLTIWEKTRGTANEVKAVGTVSNGAMTLYSINPNVKTIADFTDKDRIAVPTVRLSFNAMMLQMAAEQLWNDPHRLDHLTVALGHPDAVAALSAGYGKASVTAHIGVQPFTDRGLKIPGAHVITDSRKVFGGPLTQITLLASRQTKEKNPTLFQAVGNALEESIKVANADKRAAAVLWRDAQRAPDSVDDLLAQLNDPGFEFTSQPHRIAYFAAFLHRIGSMKAQVADWKELFWEPAHRQQGD
jgi:NitT/TauT family transport system substrate-binding protein